jgi:serine/threonine-protein kinase HipA
MHKCLYCYKEISAEDYTDQEFHETCSLIFFGTRQAPVLDYSLNDMFNLAKKIVQSQKTVTGVQPKLSLSKETKQENNENDRLTIVGLWGQYILKPPTKTYPELPEIEDTTMHLAEIAQIKTVPHTLIRLNSGELAYLTKRVDRKNNRKLHMEDMCQLTERMTENKYKGSHEQIGKVLLNLVENPGFDLVSFYELVVFTFLTGNNDMHLKNFSLLKDKTYNLCPAYDLVASELVVEGDTEDLALNLNGKKKKLKRIDFETAMKTNNLNEKVRDNIFSKFENILPQWIAQIDKSFLSNKMKENYKSLLKMKHSRLFPNA